MGKRNKFGSKGFITFVKKCEIQIFVYYFNLNYVIMQHITCYFKILGYFKINHAGQPNRPERCLQTKPTLIYCCSRNS